MLVTTLENKEIEVDEKVAQALSAYELNIKFSANSKASSGKTVIGKLEFNNGSYIYFRGNDEAIEWIEFYPTKTMYPRVYKVQSKYL